ncbi:MAG: hypothetical protein U1F65_05730 [Verrucomicrobiota bacterium]
MKKFFLTFLCAGLSLVGHAASINLTQPASQQLSVPTVTITNRYTGRFFLPDGREITGGSGGGSKSNTVFLGIDGQTNAAVAGTNSGTGRFQLWLPNYGYLLFGGSGPAAASANILYNPGHSGDPEFQIASDSMALTLGQNGQKKSVLQLGSGANTPAHNIIYINSDGGAAGITDPSMPDWLPWIAPSAPLAFVVATNNGGEVKAGFRADFNTNNGTAELQLLNPMTWTLRSVQTTRSAGRVQVSFTTNGPDFFYQARFNGGIRTDLAKSNELRGSTTFSQDLQNGVAESVHLANLNGGTGSGMAIDAWSYGPPFGNVAQLNGKIVFKYPGGPASYAGEINLSPNSNSNSNSPNNALVLAGTNNLAIAPTGLAIQAATRPVGSPGTGLILWCSNNANVYLIGTNNQIIGRFN